MNKQAMQETIEQSGWVTADEWFEGGRRLAYDSIRHRILDAPNNEEPTVSVFARTVLPPGPPPTGEATWLTLLPGFPDGSYGWAQVDRLLDPSTAPRLYVEPVGQGDSDTPDGYAYSTFERADLVQALWRHHGVRHTVLVTFDYGSLVALELLRRQLDQRDAVGGGTGLITAVFMINGGLFADAHSHPWQGTPLLRTPIGRVGVRQWERSPRSFATAMLRARMFSRAINQPRSSWPRCAQRSPGAEARSSLTVPPVSSPNTAVTPNAGTSPPSPGNSTVRSPSIWPAAARIPTSIARSTPPAGASPTPTSACFPAAI